MRTDVPKHVEVGEPITLTLAVRGAEDIAGYETNLLFDPKVAEFDGLSQRKNDLGKFGRDVGPLGGVETPRGVWMGAYSCPVDNCVAEDQGPKSDRGGRGEVKLAAVSIIPNRPGKLELKLDATKFVDSTGKAIDVESDEETLTVRVGPRSATSLLPAPEAVAEKPTGQPSTAKPSDLTGDEQVTHTDSMEVAAAWTLLREGEGPCSEPGRSQDINRDGCVDVADLQIVAADYGAEQAGSPRPANQPGAESARTPGLFLGALLTLTDWMAPTPALAAESPSFTVNSGGDAADASVGNGVCATAGGSCTLRAAIAEANLRFGPDTIAFNIPGTGVQTIQLSSQLPTLNDTTGPTTIDGYTQPGSAPNTDASVSNARIGVQVVGAGEASFEGLWVTSPGNTIRGLSFSKLNKTLRIYGSGAHDNVVVGNFVGTDAAGGYFAAAKAPGATGIMVQQGAKSNRIGGTSTSDRNVISGNSVMGITTYDEATHSNTIVNNMIGLAPTGTRRLANLGHGIDMNLGSAYNVVGGTQPGERNVVSGNGGEGIEVSHSTTTVENKIIGNFVGTDATGKVAPPYARNGANGIHLEDSVVATVVAGNVIGNSGLSGVHVQGFSTSGNHLYDNRIGVSLDGSAIPNAEWGVRLDYHGSKSRIGPNNVIANNPDGIVILNEDVDGNTITRNSIFANTGLGIDIDPLGFVNANDAGDADTGPNDQINYPVLEGATPTEVTGTACAGCTVEVFLSDGGAEAYGEGKTFVGSSIAASNGTFSVATSGLSGGDYATATATDTAGNTSEFSLNRLVVGGQTPPPSDATKPTITVTTPAEGSSYAANEDVKAAYSCADEQGGSGLKSCTGTVANGASIDTGSPGEKSFTVTAQDNAGNTASVTRVYTVTPGPDTVAPDTTITSGPPDVTSNTSASFAFSSEPGAQFRCSLDGAAFAPCSSPRSYAALVNGLHTFRVAAVDGAGNIDATPATRSWTVDTVLPTVTSMSPRNASVIRDTTPTIRATVRDNLTDLQKANIKLYVNGVLISPTAYSYAAATDALVYNSPRIAKGKKTVRIVATDAAGNVRSTSWYFTIN